MSKIHIGTIQALRIIGIDPGLIRTGYGIIETHGQRLTLVEGGIVSGGKSSLPLEQRLEYIYSGLDEVLSEYRPKVLALENVYSHYNHPYTAVLMGHARGVICLAAAKNNIEVFSYAATKVKNILTGSGRASKSQIQLSIKARLGLNKVPEPNDIADALAIALCHWENNAPLGKQIR